MICVRIHYNHHYFLARANKHQEIYEKVLSITEETETAIDVADWCELATIGETYEHEKFIAEIYDSAF